MISAVNTPEEATLSLFRLYPQKRLPDSHTLQSKGWARLSGFIGACEEVDLEGTTISFERSSALTAKVFKAKAEENIFLAVHPSNGDSAKMYSPGFALQAPHITVGPNIEVLDGSSGTLNCHRLTLLTLDQEKDLSFGQKVLKSWINSEAESIVTYLPIALSPKKENA
jgi:hypothetical protein